LPPHADTEGEGGDDDEDEEDEDDKADDEEDEDEENDEYAEGEEVLQDKPKLGIHPLLFLTFSNTNVLSASVQMRV